MREKIRVEKPVSSKTSRAVARSPVDLEQQGPAMLKQLAESLILDKLKGQLVQSRWLARVEVAEEAQTYLSTLASSATARAYNLAIRKFLAWCDAGSVHPFLVSPSTADLYVSGLCDVGLASASVRALVAGVSAWFTWLERRHPLENPFRGSTARPTRGPAGRLVYPDQSEVLLILQSSPAVDKAGVAVLAYRGLRVGALPSLSIRGTHFRAESKGAIVTGEMPPEALDFIDAADLDRGGPFVGTTAGQWSSRLQKRMARMATAAMLRAPYSAHDFRHFYASREYLKDRDLRRVSELLGHSSIGMTERYVHLQLGL